MRLGIKGKQVLGVTSIVGAVVVVLSLSAPVAPRARQPRREPRARRAAGQRDLHRAREIVGRRAPTRQAARAPIPGCARFSSRACIRRTSRSRRSSTRADSPSRTPIRALEGQQLPVGGDLMDSLLARSPLLAAARDLLAGRAGTSSCAQPLLLGEREIGSIRIGVSTLLIRKELDRVARPGRRHGARGPRRRGPRARCSWRNCCCGRSTSSGAA